MYRLSCSADNLRKSAVAAQCCVYILYFEVKATQEKGIVDRVKSRRVRNRWTRQASVIPSEFKRAKSQIHALLFGFEVLQY
jgi:hypothetical protein